MLRVCTQCPPEHVRGQFREVRIQHGLTQKIISFKVAGVLFQNVPQMSQSLKVSGLINELVDFVLIFLQGDFRHKVLLWAISQIRESPRL